MGLLKYLHRLWATHLYFGAIEAFNRKDFRKAIALFEKAHRYDPGNSGSDVDVFLAMSFHALGDIPKALALYRVSLEGLMRNPPDVEYIREVACVGIGNYLKLLNDVGDEPTEIAKAEELLAEIGRKPARRQT